MKNQLQVGDKIKVNTPIFVDEVFWVAEIQNDGAFLLLADEPGGVGLTGLSANNPACHIEVLS